MDEWMDGWMDGWINKDFSSSFYSVRSTKKETLSSLQIARKHGLAAKFSGSGGAVVMTPGFSYKEEEIEEVRK